MHPNQSLLHAVELLVLQAGIQGDEVLDLVMQNLDAVPPEEHGKVRLRLEALLLG